MALFVLLFKYYALRKAFDISVENCDYYSVIGWTNTLEKLNYKAEVCFFGNSLTCYSNFQKDFPKKKVVILGYPGQGIKGMIKRCNQITAVHPDKIFIMAGINDLNLRKMSYNEFCEYYEELVDSISSQNMHTEIFIQSILPVNHGINSDLPQTKIILAANERIRYLASTKGCKYIDLFSLYVDDNNEMKNLYTVDGLHLSPKGYQLWANYIKEMINY